MKTPTNYFNRRKAAFLSALLMAAFSFAFLSSCSSKSGGGTASEPVKVTGITIAPTSVNALSGKTITLTASVDPANATDKTLEWKSSDTAIATVTPVAGQADKATLQTIANGTATLTVNAKDGSNKKTVVTVNVTDPVPISSVSIADKDIVNKGKTIDIPVTLNRLKLPTKRLLAQAQTRLWLRW